LAPVVVLLFSPRAGAAVGVPQMTGTLTDADARTSASEVAVTV
jgi:hypothetical protein